MSDTFASLQRTKAYAQIVDRILERVRAGGYEPGDRLPSERDLAANFGVARATLKEAIRVLEHAGVLEVRIGSGTYVSTEGTAEDVRLRAHAAAVGDFSPLDVLVARIALEPLSAEAVARRVNTGGAAVVSVLASDIDKHKSALASGSDPTEYDLAFHTHLAALSKNDVLDVQTAQLVSWMSQGTWRRYKAGARELVGEGAFVHEHELIYEAVVAGEPERAARAMREHLVSVQRGILAVSDSERGTA